MNAVMILSQRFTHIARDLRHWRGAGSQRSSDRSSSFHHDPSPTANSTMHLNLWLCLLTFMQTNALNTMRKILVTGANKGIGFGVCERLLTEWKDTYVFLGSRDQQRGKEAVDSITQKYGDDVAGRIECIVLDTTSDESVKEAAEAMKKHSPLYAVINNAGIGWGHSLQDTINTNYFGPRRVNDAFLPLIQRPNGRIVNVDSAAGPNFVKDLPDGELKNWLHKPWTIPGETAKDKIAKLDELAKTIKSDNAYGCSKALLNAFTVIQGKSTPDVIINSVTPGFIKTDLTKGAGAGKPISDGAIPLCWLCMDESLEKLPRGRYYGSDCVRSPLHVYRGPGDEPYMDDEDVVELQ
ncbi:hypothetical protein MPSEU_000991500 [Mayamaea pseudoterrestris]|nr:hypothetical protein MPSEU_000991500 [Mayamaea pseudoterrestris]